MHKGYIYLFTAGVGYAIMGVLIRILNTQIPPFSQIFLRYIGASTIAFFFLLKTGQTLKPKNVKDFTFLILLGLFGYALATITFTFAVLKAPLSTVLFLFTNYIVIVPILTYIFIKEIPGKKIIPAIFLSLMGSFLLYRPDIHVLNQGALLALLSGFLASIYYAGSRFLKKYPAPVITAYSNFSGTLMLGLLVLLKEPSFYILRTDIKSLSIYHLSPLIWLVILIFAADNFLSWLFMNKGFQTVKASTGSIILLTEPVLGSILGILLYKETLSWSGIAGIVLILGGILLVTIKN